MSLRLGDWLRSMVVKLLGRIPLSYSSWRGPDVVLCALEDKRGLRKKNYRQVGAKAGAEKGRSSEFCWFVRLPERVDRVV